jgi:hypothetical protein
MKYAFFALFCFVFALFLLCLALFCFVFALSVEAYCMAAEVQTPHTIHQTPGIH